MIFKVALPIRILFFIGFGLLFFSCGNQEGKGGLNLKKKSNSAYGEIVLVMDSVQWAGQLGDELKDIFMLPFPGIPQAEAMFNIRFVPPEKFETLLQLASNIVLVTTFDSKSNSNLWIQRFFSDESKAKVQGDSSIFKFVREDEYAKDQVLLFLFGNSEEELIKNLSQNREQIRTYLNQRERKRISAEIFKGKEERNTAEIINEEYGIKVRVPFGYDLAVHEPGFVWLSQLGTDLFRNLFFAWKPYTSESQFTQEELVKWRDELGKNYLFGSGEKDTTSYLLTDQRYIPVQFKKVNFNGQYAIEMRGLWKLKNQLRGGPFISYAFTDPERERIYYIEGFVYAPNRIKRGFMRELEATLYSFRPKSNNP